MLYRRASEKIVLLLHCSFAETCISGILSSQKSLLPSFIIDDTVRRSWTTSIHFLATGASQHVKFHDTRRRTCYTANIAVCCFSFPETLTIGTRSMHHDYVLLFMSPVVQSSSPVQWSSPAIGDTHFANSFFIHSLHFCFFILSISSCLLT